MGCGMTDRAQGDHGFATLRHAWAACVWHAPGMAQTTGVTQRSVLRVVLIVCGVLLAALAVVGVLLGGAWLVQEWLVG